MKPTTPKKQTRITDFFKQNNEQEIDIDTIERPVDRIDLQEINLMQINNQKRIESTEKISHYTDSGKLFIVLGQEPSTRGMGITGLNNRHVKIHAMIDKPRSYIYAHKTLSLWPIEKFCSRDVATALFNPHNPIFGKVVIISLYWDGTFKEIPQEAKNAARYARQNGYTILIGGDANARNTLIGSTTTDTRGRKLEDFFAEYSLSPVNEGNMPTCIRGSSTSVIDFTAVSSEFADKIKNWRVSKKDSESDHRLIEFKVENIKPIIKYHTTMTKKQETNFTKVSEQRAKDIKQKYASTKMWTVNQTENLSNELINMYKQTRDENSTRTKIKIVPKDNVWRDTRVIAQAKRHSRARNFYKKMPHLQERHIAWKKEEKELNRIRLTVRNEFHRGAMSKIVTQTDMAKLTKYAKQGAQREMALIKNKQGVLANTPEEAVTNLCDTHFPGSLTISEEGIRETIKNAEAKKKGKEIIHEDWITQDRIKKAINSFQNKKAPGLDNLTVEHLKLLGNESLGTLELLYKVMFTLNYTPANLRTSKVFMLAKLGKDDYTLAKSYRPISLAPFIFKTFERVCAWDILETALTDSPLNNRQHAYRPERSTETAISQVLNEMEKGVMKKSFTLSTFIDISSAFDGLDPIKATEAMLKKGINKNTVLWYRDYLTSRYAYFDIKGTKTIRHIKIGCPQGGVLSTILWSVAFDDLLNLFNNSKITCVGYADDGCLLISGNRLPYMYGKMNRALENCQEWATTYGLSISAEKTSYMLSTNKKLKSYTIPLEGIILNNKRIQRDTSVKYLGITINQKLNWNDHLNDKIKSAKKNLFRLKGFIGKTWGPSPKMMKYAYTSCIRPAMTYACFAYANCLTKKQIGKLRSLQRMALMMMGNYRKGKPGESLNIMTDTIPIELFIKEEATKTGIRINKHFDKNWDGNGSGKSNGHVKLIMDEIDALELPNAPTDKIPMKKIWETNYEVEIKEGSDYYTGTRCYTDGSKTSTGTGTGVCFMENDFITKTRCKGLSDHTTVFQSELEGLQLACHILNEYPSLTNENKKITILCDSQAALKAISNDSTTSKTVLETINLLNEVGKKITLNLRWIKAHVSHQGNEMADTLAKTATTLTSKKLTYLSTAYIKNKIRENTYKVWDEKWTSTDKYRQTKLFMPHPDPGKSKKIMNLNRHDLDLLVRNVTGHAHLQRHNTLITQGRYADSTKSRDLAYSLTGNENEFDYTRTQSEIDDLTDPHLAGMTCRHCKLHNTVETPIHLYDECLAHWRIRREIFGYHVIYRHTQDWDPAKLANFFSHINAENLEN